MSKPFKSLRGLPFRPAVSAIAGNHTQRLQAWLDAQPRNVNRRRAQRIVLDVARREAQQRGVLFSEGLEVAIAQLEREATAVPA